MKAAFRLAEWNVQPGRNQLTRGDEKKRLEPRVMELLCFLAEHPERILSRKRFSKPSGRTRSFRMRCSPTPSAN